MFPTHATARRIRTHRPLLVALAQEAPTEFVADFASIVFAVGQKFDQAGAIAGAEALRRGKGSGANHRRAPASEREHPPDGRSKHGTAFNA